jgi:hypothetical protein
VPQTLNNLPNVCPSAAGKIKKRLFRSAITKDRFIVCVKNPVLFNQLANSLGPHILTRCECLFRMTTERALPLASNQQQARQ